MMKCGEEPKGEPHQKLDLVYSGTKHKNVHETFLFHNESDTRYTRNRLALGVKG